MKLGLMGRKLGMTQLFNDDKRVVPVTVVRVDPNVVLQVKTEENDGYNAIKLGFEDVKPQRALKPDIGQSKAAEAAPKRFFREIRFDDAPGDDYTVGKELTVALFDKDAMVDVQGTSKGRGFAGVMKKYNFKGQCASHGTHEFFRHGGAIGMNMTPGRVHKGTKMPGQMGNKTVSVQNLKVVRVDAEQNLLFIKGAVPGPRNALVFVKHAVKS
jgi:large subunit ribosomal protein L3